MLLWLLAAALLGCRASSATGCWDTPLLAATRISGAAAHRPDPGVSASTAAECKHACCAADLCVAWTFDSDMRSGCSMFTERGILAKTGAGVVSAYRAMSVPPDSSWPPNSWDRIPQYRHSSNASGMFSAYTLANITAGNPLIAIDWEANYTATRAHHSDQNVMEQARAVRTQAISGNFA